MSLEKQTDQQRNFILTNTNLTSALDYWPNTRLHTETNNQTQVQYLLTKIPKKQTNTFKYLLLGEKGVDTYM